MLIVVFAFLSKPVSEADEPVSNYEHLKQLDRLVGRWEVTGKFLDGTDYEAEHIWRWGLNKNFLMGTFRRKDNGKFVVVAKTMIGWDVAEKRIKGWEFWDDSQGEFTLPSENTVTGSGHFHDGTKYTFVGKSTWPDNDTEEYQCDLKKGDGTEGVWKITAKRKSEN
jgi:hypothetical protein